ncbi:hypothetical protein AOQ84DRAFT_408753 [Glonium stellatum]|uniref:Uncharacterized protein n=1 Tax=Glonium stellatum TaxID=574774 RepID=A0A8E2JSA4_9PEZI|nr:hypothetical protein AOQ84DRAFT_408753 [Glonium stellatum]
MPELRWPAEERRAAIITKPVSNSFAGNSAKILNASTWATILLLLIGDLVTGSKDYLFTYKMLMSFAEANKSCEKPTALTDFLLYQTRLVEFFASTILDEKAGIMRLSSEKQPHVSFMSDALEHHQESSSKLAILLFDQAYQLLVELDPNTPGAHVLVWPYFVARAEGVLKEHRDFFYAKLEHIWVTTGYHNVRITTKTLERIWACQFSDGPPHSQRSREH